MREHTATRPHGMTAFMFDQCSPSGMLTSRTSPSRATAPPSCLQPGLAVSPGAVSGGRQCLVFARMLSGGTGDHESKEYRGHESN